MIKQPRNTPLPVTVIMLTLNEEFNLPGAIENVKGWAEDIFIVDSLSTDRTVDIALAHSAKVVQRPFTNFGDQWNFALDNLPIGTPWTLKLDPDERLSDELKDSISKVVTEAHKFEAYDMIRRLWFMGKPLHVKQPVLRLWKTGKCRFSDVLVNEHPLIEGKIGRLCGLMEHYDSRDLHHWADKQNRYTTMLAIQKARGDKLSANPRLFGNALERRMFLIRLFFKLPLRYQLQMIHELLGRGAWRDGKLGWDWSRLRVESRRLRELKEREMKITGRIPELPKASHGDYDARVLDSTFQKMLVSARESLASEPRVK
jgi:glycosyltransferase involved in cell wall biosynthesis